MDLHVNSTVTTLLSSYLIVCAQPGYCIKKWFLGVKIIIAGICRFLSMLDIGYDVGLEYYPPAVQVNCCIIWRRSNATTFNSLYKTTEMIHGHPKSLSQRSLMVDPLTPLYLQNRLGCLNYSWTRGAWHCDRIVTISDRWEYYDNVIGGWRGVQRRYRWHLLFYARRRAQMNHHYSCLVYLVNILTQFDRSGKQSASDVVYYVFGKGFASGTEWIDQLVAENELVR